MIGKHHLVFTLIWKPQVALYLGFNIREPGCSIDAATMPGSRTLPGRTQCPRCSRKFVQSVSIWRPPKGKLCSLESRIFRESSFSTLLATRVHQLEAEGMPALYCWQGSLRPRSPTMLEVLNEED